jgi:natural product biosynthesis luciferase-like monooxygenase protein
VETKFSLIFFSGDERNKYRLVMDTASFADENGFHAIWTPERHFHRFGGLYPNPSVISAGLATATKRIGLRAGSVILPLHNPVRVAEEWSVVDNLSKGRAGVALATGFSPLDFVFNPDAWEGRRETTFEAVETLRQLWEGESISMEDGVGNFVEVELHPRPVQPELPVWLTCTKSLQTFEEAGRLGTNIITGLIDMSTEELEEKLQVYFDTLEAYGHDREEKEVTIMLHTFMGPDEDEVRDIVYEPFKTYLKQFFNVVNSQQKSLNAGEGGIDAIADNDQETLLHFGFEKFFTKGSLMGSIEKCSTVVERMQGIGVTEIACLIDFGLDDSMVMDSLHFVKELKDKYS